MGLKMNWSSIFLIKFLVIFSFYLKGAVAVVMVNESLVYGLLGYPVFLSVSLKEKPDDLEWRMDTNPQTRLAQIKRKGKKMHFQKEGYTVFANGTLMINNLTEADAGNYIMSAYDQNGTTIMNSNLTLSVQEKLWPQLVENCFTKIVTCEVTHSKSPKPKLVLLSNGDRLNNTGGPFYTDGRVSMNYTLKTHSGNFICEASNEANKQRVKKEINCSDPTEDMFFYLLIGGGIAVFITILAVIIYCIRKKRAKRRKLEAEEREMRTRIAVENGLKNRKLPQPPVRGASNQPPQPYNPPPVHSEVPQQAGPPQPRPRPHQKPPRHMREKP